jgi:hypothetical protein
MTIFVIYNRHLDETGSPFHPKAKPSVELEEPTIVGQQHALMTSLH